MIENILSFFGLCLKKKADEQLGRLTMRLKDYQVAASDISSIGERYDTCKRVNFFGNTIGYDVIIRDKSCEHFFCIRQFKDKDLEYAKMCAEELCEKLNEK